MKRFFFCTVILLCFSFLFFQQDVFSQDKDINKITSIKLEEDKDSTKVIINLLSPVNKLPEIMASLETVTFTIPALYEQKTQRQFLINSKGFISKVQCFLQDNKTNFEIKRRYYCPVNVYQKENEPGIIFEFPNYYFITESSELKPGITRHYIRTVSERGPVVANALEVDLGNENISVKVGLPDDKKIKAKDTLLNIVKNSMAYAGINANYFDVKVGNPLGTLITDGTWLTGPVYDRVALGVSEDKQVYIDQIMLIGVATVYRGFRKKPFAMFDIDGLNIPFSLYKKIGLFTQNWDEELVLPEKKVAKVVNEGCIKKVVEGSVKIPKDGYVLVSNENYILDYLKKRDCIKIEWQTQPDWSNVKEAVSGGPYLIKNSEIFIDEKIQNFKFAKKDTYAPRSAVGIGKNGKLYLIAVDGRLNGYSVGVTLEQLAKLLKKLDLKEAINLDGGGSTTLIADEKILNKFSDHHERKISNGLLIFYKD